MTNMRQPERRLFFNHIFAQMPLWEVWDASVPNDDGTVWLKQDFRSIPRRLRRQMARARAKRERGAAHGSGQ